MPTLANVNGASLVPDLSNVANLIFQGKQVYDARKAEENKQNKISGLIDQIGGSAPGIAGGRVPIQADRQQSLLRIAQIDPKLAKSMQEILESGDEAALERERVETEKGLKQAMFIKKQGTHAEKINALNQFALQYQQEGRPLDKFQYLANLTEDQLDLELDRMITVGSDLKTLTSPLKPPSVREIKQGNKIITQQFDPNTGVYETIAESDRFNPKSGVTVQVGGNDTAAPVKTPAALLEDLPSSVARKADAAFVAAGGGKDGINAIDKITSEAGEQSRRAGASEILANSFPNATPEEKVELEAAMDAAVDTESGLKAARDIRGDQRRKKEGRAFQSRAVDLLKRITRNPELSNVLGSIEGAIDSRWEDSESELIADIEEAQNILTVDNFDLMTGVLSESDIGILKNLSSGALNRKRSEPRFIKDVEKLIAKLSEGLSNGGEQLADEKQVGRFKVRTK